MLIKEIEPITHVGINLLGKENLEQMVIENIELPLQKTCRIFAKKGIETVMSSANKNNILSRGEIPVEKEDIDIRNMQIGEKTPLFDEVGKGYSWIMLNFDTLSNENKDWLFELEAREGKNGEQIGNKAIWFIQPCAFSDIQYSLRTGKLDYDYLKQIVSEEEEKEIPQDIQVDERLAEFDKRHTILGYNWRNISKANSSFKNAYQ